ncbi:DUF3667 domain-containing protein [Lysobacter sp. A3-1-A15]|uniref:DUF3667 domain-containing protein n=1 Tax=Novilysobacter viscosus TaxID=3098602 RepID=UPI002ED98974
MSKHDTPTQCENCATPLQGGYCHRCGQSAVNPVRDAQHALVEVFESFWHLDGRVFRTLRDLISPGRVARDYIAGHRARYIAPLRMFVVATLLTFFVGQYTVSFGEGAIVSDGRTPVVAGVDVDIARRIEQATTREEVIRIRDQALAGVEAARETVDGVPVPGIDRRLLAATVAIRGAAGSRIAELERAAGEVPAAATPSAPPRTTAARTGEGTVVVDADDEDIWVMRFNDAPWHPVDNPVAVAWLPDFANDWLNRKVGRAKENLPRLEDDPELLKASMMQALPTALFMLVPVFALLLKLFYLFSGRLYLEHLVVALYSHVYLVVVLLGLFLLEALDGLVEGPAPWASVAIRLASIALWCWLPLYLLLMQKRVYAQGWPITLAKYFALGLAYFMLVSMAVLYATLAGLVSA